MEESGFCVPLPQDVPSAPSVRRCSPLAALSCASSSPPRPPLRGDGIPEVVSETPALSCGWRELPQAWPPSDSALGDMFTGGCPGIGGGPLCVRRTVLSSGLPSLAVSVCQGGAGLCPGPMGFTEPVCGDNREEPVDKPVKQPCQITEPESYCQQPTHRTYGREGHAHHSLQNCRWQSRRGNRDQSRLITRERCCG